MNPALARVLHSFPQRNFRRARLSAIWVCLQFALPCGVFYQLRPTVALPCGALVPWSRETLLQITQSTTMRPRTLSWPLQPSSLLCIVLALTSVVQASLGDRQPEFKSCVAVSYPLLEAVELVGGVDVWKTVVLTV